MDIVIVRRGAIAVVSRCYYRGHEWHEWAMTCHPTSPTTRHLLILVIVLPVSVGVELFFTMRLYISQPRGSGQEKRSAATLPNLPIYIGRDPIIVIKGDLQGLMISYCGFIHAVVCVTFDSWLVNISTLVVIARWLPLKWNVSVGGSIFSSSAFPSCPLLPAG
ncbi:hypothetical protein GGR53DRAFT_199592 [Hypoxylon sp. FL1150]|nr:hypothetical protein GGR53DRAFT_199592 [Hypoxylon sp. FL1150]